MAGADAAGRGTIVARAAQEAALGVVGVVGAAGFVRGQHTNGVLPTIEPSANTNASVHREPDINP